jgi:actin-related protein
VDLRGQPAPESVAHLFGDQSWIYGSRAIQSIRESADETGYTMLQAQYPVEKGEVKENQWDNLQRLIENIVKNELKVKELSQYPMLLTCSPSTKKDSRSQLAQRMFKNLNVPSICICNTAVLSLFATGRTTGIVLDIGEGVTHVVPVFEGYALRHAIECLPVAGQNLTKYLLKIIVKQGIVKPSQIKDENAQQIKEKMCKTRPQSGGASDKKGEEQEFEHDEVVITIDEECIYDPAECLFNPAVLGKNFAKEKGIHSLLFDSISRCDGYIRNTLFKNIVLAGGTSMLTDIVTRLQNELTALTNGNEFLQIFPDSQRKHAAWIGGSIYATLPTIAQILISRSEFDADANVVHKKYI